MFQPHEANSGERIRTANVARQNDLPLSESTNCGWTGIACAVSHIDHYLVHSPPVEVGAHRRRELVDVRVHLLVFGSAPTKLAVSVLRVRLCREVLAEGPGDRETRDILKWVGYVSHG
jgi:hypothetical protein